MAWQWNSHVKLLRLCLVLYLFAADLFPSIRSVLSCLLKVYLLFCLLLCLILCHVGLDLQLSTVGS